MFFLTLPCFFFGLLVIYAAHGSNRPLERKSPDHTRRRRRRRRRLKRRRKRRIRERSRKRRRGGGEGGPPSSDMEFSLGRNDMGAMSVWGQECLGP